VVAERGCAGGVRLLNVEVEQRGFRPKNRRHLELGGGGRGGVAAGCTDGARRWISIDGDNDILCLVRVSVVGGSNDRDTLVRFLAIEKLVEAAVGGGGRGWRGRSKDSRRGGGQGAEEENGVLARGRRRGRARVILF
jgi:hypothetical protein